MAPAGPQRPAAAGACLERPAREVRHVVLAARGLVVRERSVPRVDVVHRPPLAVAVDEHGAAPRDPPLSADLCHRLRMVHERHGVERSADENDLPVELDDACVGRAVPVGVVVRMR